MTRSQQAPADHQLFSGAFLVIGYRGGGEERPENTLAALAYAREIGAIPEFDLSLARDGAIVAFHDPVLSRITDCTGRVTEHSAKQLQNLDAAYWFGPDQDYPYRGKGVRIPLLQELLAYDRGPLILDIHFESETVLSDLVDAIHAAQAQSRVAIACLSGRMCERLRKLDPMLLVAAEPAVVKWRVLGERLGLDGLHRRSRQVFFVPEKHAGMRILTQRFVANCRSRGECVFALKVGRANTARRLRTLGVKGVFTMHPGQLCRELGVENAW